MKSQPCLAYLRGWQAKQFRASTTSVRFVEFYIVNSIWSNGWGYYAECIGTCVMAFPFSGRLRCYQHSQGNDKRELGSPICHSVTHPTFSGPGRVRVSSSEFDWLPSIDTFYYCHTIPIESNSIKLLLIRQAIKPFTHSL